MIHTYKYMYILDKHTRWVAGWVDGWMGLQRVITFLDRYDPYKGKGGLDSAVTDVWKHAGLPRTAPWLPPPGLPRTAACPPPGNLGRRRHAEERARTKIPRPCGNPRCLRAVACLLAAFLASRRGVRWEEGCRRNPNSILTIEFYY